MPVRGVVRHEIEDQADAARVQRPNQPVEILERAEQRVDPDIIGDVVAEIRHRRRIDRRDPDRADPEPAEILDPLENALQIADAIAVAVLERARIDLVDDRLLPPVRIVDQVF
jgi:hypothetical protein